MIRTGFVERFFSDSGAGDVPYVLFVPHGYSEDREWPAILFLHGAGETGRDGVSQTRVGLGPAVRKREKAFPYLTVFPQSWQGTWRAGTQDALRALAILDDVRRSFRVDANRVHLTGISMGGNGTWSIAMEHPERWASIVPVCGWGEPTLAGRIREIPCWAFHGEADDVIPVETTRVLIDALHAAGAKPRYTEYPGVAHNSWDAAYATTELYDWWASQSRSLRV